MRKSALAVGVTAIIISIPTLAADGPDWNYVEGGYISTDIDNLGSDLDGWEVAASWNVWDWVYVHGSYFDQQEDTLLNFDVDIDLEVMSLGGGAIWRFTEVAHLYGEVSYEDWSLEANDPADIEVDESGYRAAVGGRAVVWRGLELNAEVGYFDVDDIADGEGYFRVGAMYKFWRGFSIGGSFEEIDEVQSWRGTLRYAF